MREVCGDEFLAMIGRWSFKIVGSYVHARRLCAASRGLRGSVEDTVSLKWKGAGQALTTD